jgi:peptide/nickel transport system ATP-binding protein
LTSVPLDQEVRHVPLERQEAAVTATEQPLLVEVENLKVTFQRHGASVRALRGVSVTIPAGAIVAVVGESGSGKSVLGLSMLGLLPESPAPQLAGTVRFGEVDMLAGSEAVRRATRRAHMGAVFQDPMTSLNPTMTVGAQIMEVAGSQPQTLRLLELVGVPAARSRLRAYPHELSGGLRQRVMLAMAVAGTPRFVLADEPTTALDVTVQAQILALLKDLRDELGCAFAFITHDLGVAAQIADQVIVLYGGRVAETGPTADVLMNPSHPYTAALLTSRLDLGSDRARPLRTLRGEPPDPRDPPPGCPFAPRCSLRVAACEVEPPPTERSHRHAGIVACIRQDADIEHDWAAESQPWAALAATEQAAIAVHDVHREFRLGAGFRSRGVLHALRGVDLELRAGGSVAIVGESGSGKSTLLRIIAGLDRADRGTVALRGDAQMVFQDAGASLTPWLNVGDLLEERLRGESLSRAARRARVERALEIVGLPAELRSAMPRELSGGQRQRVAFARATIKPPTVLLCDEPTSALDASLAASVLNLVGELRREFGMAVIFVTHDLAVARLIGDEIVVMYLGRVVERGSCAQVIGAPVHPYTRSLLSSVPALGSDPVRLPGDPPSPIELPSGCAFHPRCPDCTDVCPSLATELWTATEDTGDAHRVACIHAAGFTREAEHAAGFADDGEGAR